jgi:hypothetical protein
MIAFRVSEEEYERLRSVCVSLGARSVSDLARSAINRFIGGEWDEGDPLTSQVALLNRQVVQLKTMVDEHSSKLGELEGLKPAGPRE